MCIQCLTEALVWKKQVLPGYYLMKAQVDYLPVIKKGMYGLIRCNDPDVVWDVEPMIDPLHGMSDEEIESISEDSAEWKAHGQFLETAQNFCEWFRLDYDRVGSKYKNWGLDPEVAYNIIHACKIAGYDKDKDGAFEYWLLNHIARFLELEKEVADVGKINRGEEKDIDVEQGEVVDAR